MKIFKLNSNCVAFESEQEFIDAFTILADGDLLSDDTIVEGNSNLKFSRIKEFVEVFGLGNVYFENSFKHGHVAEIWFDLSKVKNIDSRVWIDADEVSIEHGFMRIWFD